MASEVQFRVRWSLRGIHWLECGHKYRSLLRDCNHFFLHSITTVVAIDFPFLALSLKTSDSSVREQCLFFSLHCLCRPPFLLTGTGFCSFLCTTCADLRCL